MLMKLRFHLFYRLDDAANIGPCTCCLVHFDTNTEEHVVHAPLYWLFRLSKVIKHYHPVQWRISLQRTWPLLEFFWWFGRQNDYLYPPAGSNAKSYPFVKPHLWRTRFGIATSWSLAKTIGC